MLSDRERRELALIEQGLLASDRRFADGFRHEEAAPTRPRRWPGRLLIGFGVFLIVVAVATGAEELFLQGLLFGGTGVVWWRLRARGRGTSAPGGQAHGPGQRPDAPPPEWFRPV